MVKPTIISPRKKTKKNEEYLVGREWLLHLSDLVWENLLGKFVNEEITHPTSVRKLLIKHTLFEILEKKKKKKKKTGIKIFPDLAI